MGSNLMGCRVIRSVVVKMAGSFDDKSVENIHNYLNL